MTFITGSPGKWTLVDHGSSDITKAIIFSGMVALVIRALSITGLQLHLSTTPLVERKLKEKSGRGWMAPSDRKSPRGLMFWF